MPRFEVGMLRYMEHEEMRVLQAIETGMKNHELVPRSLISSLAGLRHGGAYKILSTLVRYKLVGYDNLKSEGYRLTFLGYDYLALKALTSRDSIAGVGNKIGVGKESDIYIVCDADENQMALKIHRLGRTSFRAIKSKRDYHRNRTYASWITLSRLSAAKEFAYMKVLYDRGFPVPKPVDFNRHCVVMGLVDGFPLCNVKVVDKPGKLFHRLMKILVKFAECGLIHGDYNEFNLMVSEQGDVTVIDFPQMVSTEHENAEYYFDRDVQCIRDFFRKRFDFEAEAWPSFADVHRAERLDELVNASGFDAQDQFLLHSNLDAFMKYAAAKPSAGEESIAKGAVSDDDGNADSQAEEEDSGDEADGYDEDEQAEGADEDEVEDEVEERTIEGTVTLADSDDEADYTPRVPVAPRVEKESSPASAETTAVNTAAAEQNGEPEEDDLMPLHELNRQRLAFRDSDLSSVPRANPRVRSGDSLSSNVSTASRVSGAPRMAPKEVRQRVRSSLQRRGRGGGAGGRSKTTRNRNKDAAKQDRAQASKSTSAAW
ncbi:uncharacterized protein MONBRDRAFT_38815 [Monosiga brevicollis MX1]|uniref:non-specific serine/threonine protein kinase n=1 Tax=Monosiga brevicollis TaxID=81824 RepID=A9VAB1_MONBE|nr:uncharacterized protein MONBRDRAFT_38815 [Monosiga brevicollis MX1]EDQ85509.1 predicted protein [Monosiga brevicollis MX1]|eukprot:XP_001749700.1 hypothetical protein [Monosiga brevicollis MX1]